LLSRSWVNVNDPGQRATILDTMIARIYNSKSNLLIAITSALSRAQCVGGISIKVLQCNAAEHI
jgi:hypothetical protein